MAKLPTVEQMKFRRYPPLKSGPPILWPTKRYFRRNEGSTDYATIPEVTLAGDFVIEFDCLIQELPPVDFYSPILGTEPSHADRLAISILPSGAIRVDAPTRGTRIDSSFIISINTLVALSISRIGGVVTILNRSTNESSSGSFTGTDLVFNSLLTHFGHYFIGILANLKIYDAGTLVRDYPLNDNSSTIRDLANGQDGTIINGNASDWGLFDRQTDGDWLGQELSSRVSVSAPPDAAGGGFYYWTLSPTLVGTTYRISARSIIETTPSALGVGWSGASGVPANPPFRITSGATGVVGGDYTATSATGNRLFYSDDSGIASFDNVSVKEVLKNA